MTNGYMQYLTTRLSLIALCALSTLLLPCLGVAQDQPPQILITNVNIFDGKTDGLANNMNVLVEGNLIKTLSSSAINAPDATVLDGGGR